MDFTLLLKILPSLGKESWEVVRAILLLQNSEELLLEEMKALQLLRVEAEKQVKLEEATGDKSCGDRLKGWIDNVTELNEQVTKFDSMFGHRPCCLACCSPSLLPSGFKLSLDVADMTKKVRRLKDSRSEIDVTAIQLRASELPVSYGTPLIGAQGTLDKISNYLRNDDSVGIIGIYGMGGSGKTSLLEKIFYEFHSCEPAIFELVIFAKVSRKMDTQNLQSDILGPREINTTKLRSDIARQFDLPNPDTCDADLLYNIARRKRFLLLLDDVWEELDLSELRIPTPDHKNKCKIVLTTRSFDVCSQMGAQPIKVELLKEGDAKTFFKSHLKTKKALNSDRIAPLIDMVVSECGGLPLALKTVGQAMALKSSYDDWVDARDCLQTSPKELGGMEKKVFALLKFSYENLNSEWLKSCLLYCSLFPDKFDIDKEQLVEYWIGQGFLDREEPTDINKARIYGRRFLGILMASCLLDSGTDEDNHVKMHDVVRDMALWISGKKFVVGNTPRSSARKMTYESWVDAERISLMESSIVSLPQEPRCPNLSTLLLNKNHSIKKIPEKFFEYMGALRVLDLSDTRIEELPNGVSNLGNLHHLNLSKTLIKSLPAEVGNLVNIRHLNLSSTKYLVKIPRKAISTLTQLQTLYLFNSAYQSWRRDDTSSDNQERAVSFEDLAMLPKLEELGLDVKEPRTLDSFHIYDLLQSTVCLYLTGIDGLAPDEITLALRKMNALRELCISNFQGSGYLDLSGKDLCKLKILKLFDLHNIEIKWTEIEDKTFPLVRLEISGCRALKNLSWIQHFMCLQTISLRYCDELKEVISQEGDGKETRVSFETLREITFHGLPKLESIYWRTMELPSLEILRVFNCPKLEKLPLSNDADIKKSGEVRCQKEWWDTLHFKPTTITPKFSPLDMING